MKISCKLTFFHGDFQTNKPTTNLFTPPFSRGCYFTFCHGLILNEKWAKFYFATTSIFNTLQALPQQKFNWSCRCNTNQASPSTPIWIYTIQYYLPHNSVLLLQPPHNICRSFPLLMPILRQLRGTWAGKCRLKEKRIRSNNAKSFPRHRQRQRKLLS